MTEQNNNGFPNAEQNPQEIDNNNFSNLETPPQDYTSPTPDFTQAPTPESNFDSPQDYSNPDSAPVSDFANSGFDQFNTNPVNDYSTIDPSVPNPTTPNTFEEKESGNKTFLIAAIVGVVVLLILAVVLVVANLSPKDDEPETLPETTNSETTSTPTEPEPTEVVFDNTKTGGEGTPASESRIYNETEIPSEWRVQKFRPPAIDQEGNCINISLCGPNADQDSDGAETIDEYNYQLDPLVEDTDADGISDGDELFVYHTNPSEDDTDGDGFTDGQEIANCFDPTLLTVQLSSTKLNQIATNISLQKLHEPTITTLTKASGTKEDINNNGTVIIKCEAKPSSTNSTTTGSNSTNETNQTTQGNVGNTNNPAEIN
ncbi:hypothetical protein HC766_09530 [Candidatus Gracilibacteria bacterium]|nr:hypothetical protein [Candidatus Gracilibacteria bacterium]